MFQSAGAEVISSPIEYKLSEDLVGSRYYQNQCHKPTQKLYKKLYKNRREDEGETVIKTHR